MQNHVNILSCQAMAHYSTKQIVNEKQTFYDLDFSFCWFNFEVVWYSLEQNISWICWQAFIYCCRLHQVWEGTGKHALIGSLNHQHPRLCGTDQTHHFGKREMPQLLWCVCPVHLSPSKSCPYIIKNLLAKDHTLKERTVLAVSDIILLLEFCLKNTYFSFQDQFYEQVEGAAMVPQSVPL